MRNIEAPSLKPCCCGKSINITYSKCVSVALGTRHAMRISRIVLSVAWHVPPYISTLSHKRQDNRKQSAGNKMCVLISLQNLPKTFTILRRIKSDIITNIHRASCKVPFYNKTCVFWIDLEKYSYIKFHENPSTGRRFIP